MLLPPNTTTTTTSYRSWIKSSKRNGAGLTFVLQGTQATVELDRAKSEYSDLSGFMILGVQFWFLENKKQVYTVRLVSIICFRTMDKIKTVYLIYKV